MVWSSDMRWLVYQFGWKEEADIYGYQPGAEAPLTPLVNTEFSELSPALSPDGQWLTYASNRTGRYEVYVRPFPNVGDSQWRVSPEGGTDPLWAHNGRELFYKNGQDQLVAAEYVAEPTFRLLTEHPLFSVAGYQFWPVNHSFAVSADDQQFVMLRQLGSTSRELDLTFNFFEELKRLVPTK
jgi:serine/threonine-protein kinase